LLWRTGRGLPISHLPPVRLTTRGPYAVTRHPIYVGYVAAFAGAGAIAGSVGRSVIVATLVALGSVIYAFGFEEERLQRRFGARGGGGGGDQYVGRHGAGRRRPLPGAHRLVARGARRRRSRGQPGDVARVSCGSAAGRSTEHAAAGGIRVVGRHPRSVPPRDGARVARPSGRAASARRGGTRGARGPGSRAHRLLHLRVLLRSPARAGHPLD